MFSNHWDRAQQIFQPLALLDAPMIEDVELAIQKLRERRCVGVENGRINPIGNDAILRWEEPRDKLSGRSGDRDATVEPPEIMPQKRARRTIGPTRRRGQTGARVG